MVIYAAKSSRLFLETMSIDDHSESYHWLMSNEASMMWSVRKPDATKAESLENMRKYLPSPDEPWNERWVIMLKGEKEDVKPKMIGTVGIVREVEIGYRIHPDYWGKGYMSEALTMFLDMWWGLGVSQKYTRLAAAADPDNIASTRILLKHGFIKGEYKKDYYARAFLGGEVKSDLQHFYLDRPVLTEKV
ncbi:GNAT domain-containing protein [Rhexocercosporidium sp. MPI-PUGE-AT-0058]|nr:GNAT domain-containing protein [Rhexocercosporidium sp. MPI-PUGE-AT-0058]